MYYGVSIAFTFVMSYMVKLQVLEKSRIKKTSEELEEAYRKLLMSHSKVQQLTIEKERNRMAREIHDTLAHTLTALVVQLEASKRLLDVDKEKVRVELDKAQELTRSGLNEVRRSVKALRPEALEKHEFFDALDSLINELRNYIKAGITYERQVDDCINLNENQEIAIYRIIQESVTNSIRHGKAKEINIQIRCDEKNLTLQIEDNGLGCKHIKKGYGLQGITERAEALDGSVIFNKGEGEGFKIEVRFPLKGGLPHEN